MTQGKPCHHGVTGFCLKCADAEIWAQNEAGKFRKPKSVKPHTNEHLRARPHRADRSGIAPPIEIPDEDT